MTGSLAAEAVPAAVPVALSLRLRALCKICSRPTFVALGTSLRSQPAGLQEAFQEKGMRNDWIKTAMRAGTMASVALLVAACGGDDDDDDDDSPSTLVSPSAVIQRVAVMNPSLFGVVLSVGGIEAESATTKSAIRPGVKTVTRSAVTPKATQTFDCPNSGYVELLGTETESVDSPFTDDDFVVTSANYVNCGYSVQGNSAAISITYDGPLAYGCRADGTAGGDCEISWEQDGTSDERLTEAVAFQADDGSDAVDQAGVYAEFNSRTSDATLDYESWQDIVGNLRIGDDAQDYTQAIGTEDAPVFESYETIGSGSSASVAYTIEADENSFSADDCDLGTYSVRTTEPVTYSASDTSEYDGGTIEVEQDGEVGTITINGDGSYKVTDAEGDSQTFSNGQAVIQALGTCAPYVY